MSRHTGEAADCGLVGTGGHRTVIDANRAFRFARGAVWHMEIAVPQLAAASRGGATADDLVRAAATHLEDAARDVASAGTMGGTVVTQTDAGLGALLLRGAADLRSGTARPSDVADAVRRARWQAQDGIHALAPHLSLDQELLALAPAGGAPAHELALVDDIASARAFRVNSDVQRSMYQRILTDGDVDPDPLRMVGGYGNGNGQLAIMRVRHPDTPHLGVTVVRRPPTAQAAQEEFFARLTEHAGVDHHFAPVARRSDGSALVLAVPGRQLWDEVRGGDDIAGVMANWYRVRFPRLGEDGARLAGRMDFDAAKSIDYIGAQPDRNAGGLLGDVASGELHFIDNGFAGRGETLEPLKPALKSHFVGGVPGHATVVPEAAAEVVRGLDDAALADAHAVLGRGPDGDLPWGHALALRQDASQGFLDAMRARRDQLATGSFDYAPIDLNADPLAHMDFLLGGRRPF